MIYLGVDPGKTTGIALVRENLDVWKLAEVKGGADGFLEYWNEFLEPWYKPDVIVCESFHTREGKHGVDTTPLVVIGALKALADASGIPILMQPPGGRLKRIPDAVMKRLDLYPPGRQNRNCREALRHVLSVMKSDGNRLVLEAFRDDETPQP